MPKKQTKKPKYPKEIYAFQQPGGYMNMTGDLLELMAEYADDTQTVAIYKFDRLAKVTRTVKVE